MMEHNRGCQDPKIHYSRVSAIFFNIAPIQDCMTCCALPLLINEYCAGPAQL